MALAKLKFPIILFGAAQILKRAAQRHPAFSNRLEEHDFIAQIMTPSTGNSRKMRPLRGDRHTHVTPQRQFAGSKTFSLRFADWVPPPP